MAIIMISIIIPIYKRLQYLDKCLKSIIKQTFSDLEIICVLDGIDEVAAKKLEGWTKRDARIKHITIKHGGAAAARNAGLDIAMGEFIAFCDADDTLPSDAYDILISNYRNEINYDVIIGDYNEIFDNGDIVKFVTPNGEEDNFNSILESVTIWNRLYRRDFIYKNNLRFEVGIRGDDRLFIADLFNAEPKIKVINETVYFWHRHESDTDNSMTHNTLTTNFINDIIMWNIFINKISLRWEAHLNDHMRYSCYYILSCYKRLNIDQNSESAFALFKELVSRINWDKHEELFYDIFKSSYDEFMNKKML